MFMTTAINTDPHNKLHIRVSTLFRMFLAPALISHNAKVIKFVFSSVAPLVLVHLPFQ